MLVRSNNEIFCQFVNIENDFEWSLNENPDLKLVLDQDKLFLAGNKSQLEIKLDPSHLRRIKESYMIEVIFQKTNEGYSLVKLYPSRVMWTDAPISVHEKVIVNI